MRRVQKPLVGHVPSLRMFCGAAGGPEGEKMPRSSQKMVNTIKNSLVVRPGCNQFEP